MEALGCLGSGGVGLLEPLGHDDLVWVSNSIGESQSRALCRRRRSCQISRYSNMALANSILVFQRLRSSNSTCIRDQNDSIIALTAGCSQSKQSATGAAQTSVVSFR